MVQIDVHREFPQGLNKHDFKMVDALDANEDGVRIDPQGYAVTEYEDHKGNAVTDRRRINPDGSQEFETILNGEVLERYAVTS
jgi:hypothetical protein